MKVEIKGAFFPNPDGSSRGAALARCSVGQTVVLWRERGNDFDSYAIQVQTEDGAQLGYVPKEFTKYLDKTGYSKHGTIVSMQPEIPFKKGAGAEIIIQTREQSHD
jgi:hypothetical protein